MYQYGADLSSHRNHAFASPLPSALAFSPDHGALPPAESHLLSPTARQCPPSCVPSSPPAGACLRAPLQIERKPGSFNHSGFHRCRPGAAARAGRGGDHFGRSRQRTAFPCGTAGPLICCGGAGADWAPAEPAAAAAPQGENDLLACRRRPQRNSAWGDGKQRQEQQRQRPGCECGRRQRQWQQQRQRQREPAAGCSRGRPSYTAATATAAAAAAASQAPLCVFGCGTRSSAAAAAAAGPAPGASLQRRQQHPATQAASATAAAATAHAAVSAVDCEPPGTRRCPLVCCTALTDSRMACALNAAV